MTISVMLSKLSEGMVVSLLIFAVTLIFSLPLGLLVSFGRMAKNPVIRAVFKVYISIMRGTPPVSYTHLDVYKRQDQGFEGNPSRIEFTYDGRGLKPDVYKRQCRGCMEGAA